MRWIWGLLFAALVAPAAAAQSDKPFQGVAVGGNIVSDEVDFSIVDTETLVGEEAGGGQAVQIKPDGSAFGGWIGYRHQLENNLVLGVVLRGQDSGADEEVPGAQPAENGSFGPSPLGASLDILTDAGLDFSQPFDIRARIGRTLGAGVQVGYVFDFLMPFVEVGYANTNIKILAGDRTLIDDEMDGLRLGGGAAWRFGNNLSLELTGFLTEFDDPGDINDNRFIEVDRIEIGGGVVYTF